jgi:hypothetical protein
VSWDLKFFEPIPLPGKRKSLVTLRDAVNHMTGLPRAEQNAEHWRPAATLLGIIGERGVRGVRSNCRDAWAAQGRNECTAGVRSEAQAGPTLGKTKIEAGRMTERIFTVPIESGCDSTSGKEWTWAGLSPS